MIHVYPETDPEKLKWIVSELWSECAEDGLSFEEWTPNPSELFLSVYSDDEIIGAWRIESRNGICACVHPMIIKSQRAFSKESEGLMCEWIRNNTVARKLVAEFPSTRKDLIFFGVRCGWVREGCLTKAKEWRGEIVDLIIMGKTL